jgi:hypothetical protein
MLFSHAIFIELKKTRDIGFLISPAEKRDPFHNMRTFHFPAIALHIFFYHEKQINNISGILFFS